MGILALQAVIFGAVLYFVRRGIRERVAELRRELGGDLSLGPETSNVSGSRFGRVRATCVIALGSKRLICRKLAGEDFDIRLDEIVGTRIEKSFRGRYVWGSRFLVIELTDKNEVGFQLRDPEPWKAALDKAIAGPF